LENPLEQPFACECINCKCFYDDLGTHYKCLPGWNGTLCEINEDDARQKFKKRIICNEPD
jgi:hypothetical protein